MEIRPSPQVRYKRFLVGAGIAFGMLILSGCAAQANGVAHVWAWSPLIDVTSGFIQGVTLLVVGLYVLIRDLLEIIPGAPKWPSTDLFQEGRSGLYDLAWYVGVLAGPYGALRLIGLFGVRRKNAGASRH